LVARGQILRGAGKSLPRSFRSLQLERNITTDADMKLRLALLLPKHPGFQLFLSGFVSEPDSVKGLFEVQTFDNG